ncbi:MAG TPA: hypothetical protein VIW29_11070, partial [Polyangiaceae bacterium]
CYAVTSDGRELPVVDVTHPSFVLELSEARQRELIARFLVEQRSLARLPSVLRKLMMRVFMRGSIMAAGLRRAEGTFLDGITTYLFKLGPQNLGSFATPVDRRIAASLPAIALRLRLFDMARLLADQLAGALSAAPQKPVWLINIAGGTAIDSLNALILLQRERPWLLTQRRCVVCVLDGDAAAPAFGERAAQALRMAGAPLAGLELEFRRRVYDWQRVAELETTLQALERDDAIGIVSSEGGLFEYGSDEDILANLRVLGRCGSLLAVVGSVTRDDEPIRTLKLTSTAATKPRGLQLFAALVAKAGFAVTRSRARPLSDQVVLERTPPERSAGESAAF